MSGDLVGDPLDYNPQRQEGGVSVDSEGVQAALDALSTDGTPKDDPSPSSPESGVQHASNDDRRDVSTITKLPPIECPVVECDYQNPSSWGIAGHIGGKKEYNHDWDRIDVSPADIHELSARGTHPDESVRSLLYEDGNSRIGTDDYLAVESVRAWLVWQGLAIDKIQVYIAPRYSSVQIQPRVYLGDDWDDYVTLMRKTDGIFYDWKNERNYCSDGFVESLNPRELGVKLVADG